MRFPKQPGARGRIAVALLLFAADGLRTEVVDRIAAVVGNTAIALSEIDVELRLGALLARAPLPMTGASRGEALTRLIERRLVREDLKLTPFLRAQPEEVDAQLEELRAESYLDGLGFAAALRRYGVTEQDCRSFLEARLSFERYIAFRFMTGLHPQPAELEAYYKGEYAARHASRGTSPQPLEAVAGEIRRILIERQANALLDERLKELRALTRIRILAVSLESPAP